MRISSDFIKTNDLQMKKITLLFCLSLILLVSCRVERATKPSATGATAELLVIMNSASYQGEAGLAVSEVFQQPIPMFLAPEPKFDLVHLPPENFVELFQSHRHILIADISDTHEKSALSIEKNVWSQPQMVIRVNAPNDSLFALILKANADAFIDHFLSVEFERIINANNRIPNQAARQTVKEKFGFEMAIPEGFFVAVEGDNFVWIRRTGVAQDLELGVLIASLPYTDPAVDFAHETIEARRDSLTRKYVPGEFEGSFMTTYPELPPQFAEINFNGHFAVEARSLWRMHNDFMGGPFINFTMVQPHNNRLLILDGFVYAPGEPKRNFMRQVEALIRSISFPEAQTQPATAQ